MGGASLVFVLVWLAAPGGPRELGREGFVFETYEACRAVVELAADPVQFTCALEERDGQGDR